LCCEAKKPFNPFLGETYEFVPANKEYKFFAEQVSHHPPIGVALASADSYTLQLEMELKTKFRGNSSDVFVDGTNQMSTKFGDEFVWGHLDTCAHNVIVGWMWVDHFGTLEVTNKTTGDKGVVTFTRCGWLGAGRYDISGQITDKDGKIRLKISGKWNEIVNAIKVDSNGNDSAPHAIWRKNTKQPENKWGWAKFTFGLNTMSDAYKAVLPPTDSRLRTDRLFLELDDLEKAGEEKHRLEEKQRAEKKEREIKTETWTTNYFKKVDDAELGHKYVYFGNYWQEREERFKAANYIESAENSPKTETQAVEEITTAVEKVSIDTEQTED